MATPVISANGASLQASYTSSADASITITCATAGSSIHYTTDGSTPSVSTASYTGPLSIAGNGTKTTIKAIGVKNGMTDSAQVQTVIAINYNQVSTPQFSVAPGTYTASQSITITATAGAAIRFTTDGSTPSETKGTLYSGAISVSSNETINAIAYKTEMLDSSVATAVYAIQSSAPSFSVHSGLYSGTQQVSISSTTAGAQICYTIDGSQPKTDGQGNVTVGQQLANGGQLSVASSEIVTAIAYKSGCTDSSSVQSQYVLGFSEVFVAGGTFQRDTTASDTTTLSSFHMSINLITGAQYAAVTGLPDPSYFSSISRHPVENVNWYACLVFCNKASILQGLAPVYSINGSTDPSAWGTIPTSSNATWDAAVFNTSANGYRLPTAMENLWAMMGGTSDSIAADKSGAINVGGYNKPFAGYNGGNSADSYAWTSTTTTKSTTQSVGNLTANELGIFDLTGNVYEWCWDLGTSWPTGALTNPIGSSWVSGDDGRYLIGGSWWATLPSQGLSLMATSASTTYMIPGDLGFRVVRSQ